MRARYVVDTNVLIAASAADPVHPKDIDATPADPTLRRRVWEWLSAFEQSDSRLVLDGAGKIFEEYERKLGFNDFGIQVVMHKFSTAAADFVAREQVGVVLNSLRELPELIRTMPEEDYQRYAANARRVGTRLRAGENTKRALRKLEEVE